jgi:hypothetical protein
MSRPNEPAVPASLPVTDPGGVYVKSPAGTADSVK